METGIVAGASSALAAAGVTIFYFSTFCTDFTLVMREDIPQATEALTACAFDVRRAACVPSLVYHSPPRCYSPQRPALASRSRLSNSSHSAIASAPAADDSATPDSAGAAAPAPADTTAYVAPVHAHPSRPSHPSPLASVVVGGACSETPE